MPIKEYPQTDWMGGLAESDFSGQKGSVIEAIGVDIFDEPNAVKLSRKLTKETTGAPPSELCNFAVFAYGITSTGFNCTYWFSASSGKVWKRDSTGTWTLVYTIPDCSYVNGCGVWNMNDGTEYIFFSYARTSTGLDVLGYKSLWGLANWTDAVPVWQEVAQKFYSGLYHPMVAQAATLVIGNINCVATVTDVGGVMTFSYSGTPSTIALGDTMTKFGRGYSITALCKFGDDVLIAASRDGLNATRVVPEYNYALLCRWDCASDGFVSIKDVQENGIYNLQTCDFGAYVFAGTSGAIMTYDGSNLQIIRAIKKSIGSEDVSNGGYLITPYSACSLGKYTLFALSKNSLYGEAYNEGVYCLGRKTVSYPLALALQYPEPPFSVAGTYTFNLTGLTFGAMVSVGSIFLVSYSDADATYGTTGVAVLETAKRNANGWVRLNIYGDQERSKLFDNFALTYRKNTYTTLVSNLTLSTFHKNYDYGSASTAFVTNQENTDVNKLYFQQKIRCVALQPKINFVGDITKDDTPILTSFYCDWNEEEKL